MSKARTRALREAQEKRGPGGFVALPFALLRSRSFAALGPHSVKLLFDLLHQYNLRNNGDLSMSFEKVMKPRGWKSKDTLYKARQELLECGFIILTRQGGLHQCSLYAVTFFAVDHCEGKLDVSATRSPLGLWSKNEPVKIRSSSTPAVLDKQHLGTPAVL
ncbi:hypothetical protein SAMN05216315_13210 [Nitrosospira sp. Nsp18]|nr:hypothetical protein SAMN05216315_13210 [Nitrosospira sp. Nsp18]